MGGIPDQVEGCEPNNDDDIELGTAMWLSIHHPEASARHRDDDVSIPSFDVEIVGLTHRASRLAIKHALGMLPWANPLSASTSRADGVQQTVETPFRGGASEASSPSQAHILDSLWVVGQCGQRSSVVSLGRLLKLERSISMPVETSWPVAGHTKTKVPISSSLNPVLKAV